MENATGLQKNIESIIKIVMSKNGDAEKIGISFLSVSEKKIDYIIFLM